MKSVEGNLQVPEHLGTWGGGGGCGWVSLHGVQEFWAEVFADTEGEHRGCSPVRAAGARPGPDGAALQVNGINVEGLRHSEVVSHIKARESEARLLVVDPETDDYFKKLGVTPTEEHTKGETRLCWATPQLS